MQSYLKQRCTCNYRRSETHIRILMTIQSIQISHRTWYKTINTFKTEFLFYIKFNGEVHLAHIRTFANSSIKMRILRQRDKCEGNWAEASYTVVKLKLQQGVIICWLSTYNLHLYYIHGCITPLLYNFASSHVRGEAFAYPRGHRKVFTPRERTFDSSFRLRPLLFSTLAPPRLVLISNPVRKTSLRANLLKRELRLARHVNLERRLPRKRDLASREGS